VHVYIYIHTRGRVSKLVANRHKTCDIRSCKKHLFLDITSTNIDTLVPPLYQCIKTCSTEVFWLLSQPLLHLCFNLFVISRKFAKFFGLLVNRFTWQTLSTVNRKHFFINILWIESFCPHKNAQQNAALRYYSPPIRSPFWLLKPASEECMCICYLVVHMENLLHPVQVFYFPLWPIYWLSLVYMYTYIVKYGLV
jgi:hypothetical protein